MSTFVRRCGGRLVNRELVVSCQPFKVSRLVRWSSTSTTDLQHDHPRFPGAISSRFVQNMQWSEPSTMPTIPTYRIMNAQNVVENETQISSEVTPERVLGWYKNMLTVNIMDSIMFDAQRHGRLSFYMVSHGEEALMVGSAAALVANDVITAQYREHGVFLRRGFELKDFMSQLAGNHKDPGKGRNMPVHYSGKDKVGIHAVASTLGTQIPHATGAAYALKMEALENPDKTPRVAVSYFGEGAASEGDFHGALNVAATQDCPVIFICRNNGFARTPMWLEQQGVWDEAGDTELRVQLRKDIIQELTVAEKEKKPALGAIFSDVYAELTEEAETQRQELKRIMLKYPEEYDFDQHKGGLQGL